MVGRDGMGVTDRETTPFSLLSLDSMVNEHNEPGIKLCTDFWILASKTLHVRSEETSMCLVINNDQLCTASLRHQLCI